MGVLILAALRAAGQLVPHLARDLRGPGLRAFFCRATKEGKNAPEPTVLDSLDGAARACRFPIRGNFLRLGANEEDSATELEAVIFGLVVERVRLTPC